jgi:hypothetical protein
MSNYMPAGAERIWEEMAEEGYREDLIIEREMEDIRWEAINSLYSHQMTWKEAEAFLILWAKAFKDNEWVDEEAGFIADRLKLSRKEMYAALGDKRNLRKELENERFWKDF